MLMRFSLFGCIPGPFKVSKLNRQITSQFLISWLTTSLRGGRGTGCQSS